MALAAGIGLGIFFPTEPVRTRCLLAIAWVAAFVAYRLYRERCFLFAIVLGFATAGELLGAQANMAALNAPIGILFDHRLPSAEYEMFATIDGTLRMDATRGANGITLRLDVDHVKFERERTSTTGGVIIGVGGELTAAPVEEWREGRRLRVQASVRRPAQYLDPGVPDSQRDFAWRGMSLVGSAKSPRLVEVLEP